MPSFFRATTAIVDDVRPEIGEGTKIWHGAHVMADAVLGKDCILGQNACVGRGVKIGNGCKIQNNVNVYEGVTLEDHVFCGPSMTFTNLSKPLPRAAISRRDALQETIVRKGASFGAGCVIVCGHEIGRYAFVAAGAVVVRGARPFELLAGNPARRIGYVCVCGNRLEVVDGSASCRGRYELDGKEIECGRRYQLHADVLDLVDSPHSGD